MANENIQELKFQVGEAWKGVYSSSTPYGLANVVQDPTGLSIYRSLKSGNVGHPLSNASWWFRIIDLSSIKAESDRIAALNQAIAQDEALRVAAEELRQQHEAERVAAETQRDEAEQARISAEQQRVNKESQREAAEQQRISAEQGRVSAESARVQAEQARVLAETLRANAEDQRAANEQNRVAAEQQRIERAEQDHQRAESDHATYVDSLGAFDISSYHATDGVLAKYADLTAALGTNGANIPDDLRKGGMSVKFVQSSDNKYIQARCIADEFTTDVTLWAICDDETLVDAPDYIKAETDADGRLLFWIKSDASIDWAVGVPAPVKSYVDASIAEILNGNEGTDIDGLNKIIAFLDDFSTSDTLASLLNTKVDKEEGKGLIQDKVAESLSMVEDVEFMDAELDLEGRILGGRKANGNKFENMPLETSSATIASADDEEKIDIEIDGDGKLLSYRKKDGTKVEEAGIETKKVETGSISIEGKDFGEYLEDIDRKIPGETTDIIPYNDLLSIGTKTIKIYNPYKDSKQHQYTGQLHCHSWTKYSGYDFKVPYGFTLEEVEAMTPQERTELVDSVSEAFVQRHKDEGFDFMALTNYADFGDVTHKPVTIPANFLWLCDSYETVTSTLGVSQHMVVHGATKYAERYNTGTFNDVMNRVEDYGCISQWAHPTDISTFANHDVLATVRKRLRLMEVWDGISMRKYDVQGGMTNLATVEPEVMHDAPYDTLISQGNFAFCMAISDERPTMGRTGEAMTTPNSSMNIKNGCVKVFADTLTSEDIFNSLLTGNFYASSNSDVNINSVTIANGRYTVDVGIEGVVVEFLKEDNTIVKTVNTSVGNTVAYYDITGDEQFVRARIHKLNNLPYNADYWYYNKEWIIWTQPVFISKSIL